MKLNQRLKEFFFVYETPSHLQLNMFSNFLWPRDINESQEKRQICVKMYVNLSNARPGIRDAILSISDLPAKNDF